MQRSQWTLIPIGLILALALYIVLPGTTQIPLINKAIETRLGLDLVGGVQALLEADLRADAEVSAEAMGTATRIVENRVNGLGVTEAVVQQAGDRRIVVELPGETDPEKALAALRQTGLLEFVDMSSISAQEVYAMEQAQTTILTDVDQGSLPVSGTIISDTNVSTQVFPTVMTGASLEDAQVTTNELGQYEVAFQLDSEAANIFREFTSTHVGQILAIVLDKKIVSAPSIDNTIPDGQGVITGNYTFESANTLAVQLRYGSLPIPLKVVETRTVGPTLGQDSLQRSMIAGAIGFIIVMLFMGIYYRLPGVVADLAILYYAILAFAIFRFIPVTLTLPGIAGFLLSTGSALDANILIFERLKEELRSGRNLRQAIDLGWKRAWPSIRDSNIATLITCGILYWFGSQFGATIVKGFSLTLALGVFVSLLTAIFVTRALLNIVVNFVKPEKTERWFGL